MRVYDPSLNKYKLADLDENGNVIMLKRPSLGHRLFRSLYKSFVWTFSIAYILGEYPEMTFYTFTNLMFRAFDDKMGRINFCVGILFLCISLYIPIHFWLIINFVAKHNVNIESV